MSQTNRNRQTKPRSKETSKGFGMTDRKRSAIEIVDLTESCSDDEVSGFPPNKRKSVLASTSGVERLAVSSFASTFSGVEEGKSVLASTSGVERLAVSSFASTTCVECIAAPSVASSEVKDEEDRKMSAEELQLTKMRPEAWKLAKLMKEMTQHNEQRVNGSVISYDPMELPSQAINTVDSRIKNRLCIQGCGRFSHWIGLCQTCGQVVKGWSASDQEFIGKLGKALIDSRRHVKAADVGESFVQNLYAIIRCPHLSSFHFLDGQDGFRVDKGYAPPLDGETTKLSNVKDLAGMMSFESASAFVSELGNYGFFIPDDERAELCNLHPNGNVPRGWDYHKGLKMVRRSSFRDGHVSNLGKTEEYKMHKRQWRKESKKIKASVDANGLVPVAVPSKSGKMMSGKKMQGGRTCTVCGVTRETDSNVKRGRCGEHRTEQSHPSCTHPGCETWRSLTRGVCQKHGPRCLFDGCNNDPQKGGMCKKHGPRCSVDGCNNNPQKGGMCTKHGKQYL